MEINSPFNPIIGLQILVFRRKKNNDFKKDLNQNVEKKISESSDFGAAKVSVCPLPV